MKTIEKQLENYKSLKYRIKEEGIHYTMKDYSNWVEIEEEEFQELKKSYNDISNRLEFYIDEQILKLHKLILQSQDIRVILKGYNSEAKFLNVPSGVVTCSYDKFLEDVRTLPNSVFHFYTNSEDNESLFWDDKQLLRYKITNK